MAKKSSSKSKIDIVDLAAYIALAFAAIIFFVNMILDLIDGDLGKAMTIMVFIKDIAIFLALVLGGYNFARKRGIAIRILYWIAVVTYLVCAVVGISIGL